jgi:hypothetical protein
MPFGLKNAPTIFSRVVVKAFKEFLYKFVDAYFDDWIVFSLLKNHIITNVPTTLKGSHSLSTTYVHPT